MTTTNKNGDLMNKYNMNMDQEQVFLELCDHKLGYQSMIDRDHPYADREVDKLRPNRKVRRMTQEALDNYLEQLKSEESEYPLED